ncbi:VQ motif-containing protein 22 [Manihot esculenta]|uniref:Uncharacterized protein n=2 Tax=Manihot esculenta TaxID=3983 RepID=A0ACB7H9D7_MANES|nr:VQ motif-containing protein 22 [Manihot esculenta]KAG8649105.1 hypothetical protein MANES_08G068801v8 [Manihot esculenta]
MSLPSDWGQFYHQQNLSATMFGCDGGASDVPAATSVTSAAAASVPTSLMGGTGNSTSPNGGGGHLSPEGRVSKPVRRRSRASRRTPTTLLNTDTTNFRALVQQFTGGPSPPFASGSQLNAPSFGFSLNQRQAQVNPSAVMVPSAAGYHLQYQQQIQPSYMFSLGNNTTGASPAHGDLLFQRLGNPRSTGMDVSDELVMEGLSSHAVATPSRPPSRQPSSASSENRSNTFLF